MTAHTLYRFFDGLDHLLYVGRTINPGRRWRDHEKTKPWFNSVAKVTREIYPDAESLADAERHAIVSERPAFNVAHNANPSAYMPAPQAPFRFEDHAESFAVRLKTAQVPLEDIAGCLGDETACECSACHGKRLAAFEDLHSKYWWHPAIDAATEAVKRQYYSGHELFDWYYDLFDIELFGKMELARASRDYPLPAYARPCGAGLKVDCPICFCDHVHLIPIGAALDGPFESGCRDGLRGKYFLIDEWEELHSALEAWGDCYGKPVAA